MNHNLIEDWLKAPKPSGFVVDRLSEWIKSLRFDEHGQKLGPSQQAIADAMSASGHAVSRAMVSRWESGVDCRKAPLQSVGAEHIRAISIYSGFTLEQTAHWLGVAVPVDAGEGELHQQIADLTDVVDGLVERVDALSNTKQPSGMSPLIMRLQDDLAAMRLDVRSSEGLGRLRKISANLEHADVLPLVFRGEAVAVFDYWVDIAKVMDSVARHFYGLKYRKTHHGWDFTRVKAVAIDAMSARTEREERVPRG